MSMLKMSNRKKKILFKTKVIAFYLRIDAAFRKLKDDGCNRSMFILVRFPGQSLHGWG